MTFDGYVRISRVAGREGVSFLSPTIQRDSIARQAAAKGIELGEIVEERDVSGGKRIGQRKLERLVEKIERRESGGLIVWKVSRFSRNLLDGVQTAARIREAGGHIVAEDLDTSAPMGRAMLGLMLGFAEEELDQRRAVWADAQRRAVKRGVHVASRTPSGYLKRDGQDKRLEPDPKAVPVIRELYRRRARREGWTALARFLDESGLRGPYQNAAWTPSAVSKLVRNRVYLGEARSGQNVNPAAHDPIVTQAEWEAAQWQGNPTSVPRSGDGQLLSGIVRCAGCRYLMKPETMKDRDGSRLALYRCRGRHAAGKCPAPATILARIVDPHVEQTFLDALGSDGPLAEMVEAGGMVSLAVEAAEDAERELDAYLEADVAKVVGAAKFRAGVEERQRKLDTARDALAQARRESLLADELVALSGDFSADWPKLSTAEKRHLLSSVLDAVFIRAGRGLPVERRSLLVWHGQAPGNLPRRGRRVPLESLAWPEDKRPAAGRAAAR
jgi:site-specific DNA recombinase